MNAFFIYAGKRNYNKGIVHEYRVLALLEQNDGRSAGEFRTWLSKEKLFSNETIGMIHEIEMTTDERVSYNKKAPLRAYWKCVADMTDWKTQNMTAQSYEDMVKNPNFGNVIEILAPLRTSYRTMTQSQKRLLIAEIIRVVTG